MRIPRPSEEHANTFTHGLGLALAVVGSVVLLTTAFRYGGPWERWGCGIYAVTLLAAYTASTLSHAFADPRLRHAWRAADQAIIFLFIAGSWTPIAFAWLRHGPWWWLHGSMYAVAVVGFASKALFTHRVHLGAVSLVAYVVLGWMPIVCAWPMIGVVHTGMLIWLGLSGICYMVGTVFFVLDHRYPYFHAAWHVMVLAGTATHYVGVLAYCTGAPA